MLFSTIYTPGCHIYALSRPGSSHLRMVVAVGRRLLVFTWKHSAEWLVWCCPTMELDTVEGFTFIRVLLFMSDRIKYLKYFSSQVKLFVNKSNEFNKLLLLPHLLYILELKLKSRQIWQLMYFVGFNFKPNQDDTLRFVFANATYVLSGTGMFWCTADRLSHRWIKRGKWWY
jgi:hypothetical protein